jgi:hypothetical protein
MIYSGSGPDFLIPSRYGSISSPDPSLKLGKVKKASETHQPKTYQDSLNANMVKKIIFQKCNTSIKNAEFESLKEVAKKHTRKNYQQKRD